MSTIKRQPRTLFIQPVYLLLLILSIAYISLLYRDAVILKPSGHGRVELFMISVTIAIPELIIWAIAFISSARLKVYAKSIKNSKDGQAMTYLADALFLMSIYIVLICSTYSVVSLFRRSSNLHNIVLLENYLPLGVAFASSVLLMFSAKRFSQLVATRIPKVAIAASAVIFVVVVGLFVWQFSKIHPSELVDDDVPRFVSSVNALIYTYVLPQVILWGMGLLACLEIAHYSFYVRGRIYKTLLANLYQGVLVVFVCIFCAQLLTLTNISLNKFSFPLVLVYGLLLLGSLGFALIYKGTSDLSKLEKI